MSRSKQPGRSTFVVGHQRPDTDSPVSAAVYADLLNSLSPEETFEGIVLGELSGQTKWLFAEAGTPLPRQVCAMGNFQAAQAVRCAHRRP